MDFITNMLGLLLLVICILIVLIFLKDYIRIGKKTVKAAKRSSEAIVYEIRYKNKKIDEGTIDMNSLPVQFGREAGSGNDIVVAPDKLPEDDRMAVSRAWFFIQKDASDRLVVYAAEPSAGGEKKTSAKAKLVISNGDGLRPVRSVRLESELILKAEKFLVVLGVQK